MTGKAADRLQRLLAVVPYVVRHPGTPLEELARLFDVSETALTDDLSLLFMTGLPPYTPGDLVDVEIDRGRVWIRMAEHFSRPARLTRTEAMALSLKGTELLDAPGLPEAEALRTALDKLTASLGGPGPMTVDAGASSVGETAHLEEVRKAVASHLSLEIDYYSAARDEVATRRVDPEHLFSAIGNWYLVAWDHRSDEERLFRVDRIRAVRATGDPFEPRGLAGPGRELYTPQPDDVRVRLRLQPGARWVAEAYRAEEVVEGEEGLEVVLPTGDLAWIAKLLLRLGDQATVMDPPELADQVRRLAQETLARYSRDP